MKKTIGKKVVLEHLFKTPVISIACSKASIGRTTLYRWKQQDEEFSLAVDEALKEGCEFISDIAESQLISLIKQGNFSAVAFWLKNHREAYATKVDLRGEVHVRDELTPEENKVLEEALINIIGFPDKNYELLNGIGGENTQKPKIANSGGA